MFPRIVCILSVCLVLADVRAQISSPSERSILSVVPPPPIDSSPAGMADMETMIQVQADRTPAQTERARRVNSQTPFSFARPVLGEWFHSKEFPRTAAVFEQINRETNRVIEASKAQWNRPRPYQRDPRVNIVVGLPRNASYPSGHSAIAEVWAAVLGAVFPEDAAAFQKQVHEVMWARVLAGVHFPSDTTAGEKLGEAIARELLASPQIKKAIEAIREETAPFRLKKAA